MQLMRMHRSEFHVNLTPSSQVSIKTRKNNNIHILISQSVRVGPIVVLSINNFLTKNNDSNEESFDSYFACFLFIVFLSIYIASIIASGCCQKCLDIIVLTLHF